MKRNFKWQPINPDPTDALIEKVSFYVTIILVFSLIVGIFVSYSAVKLIGEKKHRDKSSMGSDSFDNSSSEENRRSKSSHSKSSSSINDDPILDGLLISVPDST